MTGDPIASLVELKLLGFDLLAHASCHQPHRLVRGCKHWRVCKWRKLLRAAGSPGPAQFAPFGDPVPCYRLMAMGINAEES